MGFCVFRHFGFFIFSQMSREQIESRQNFPRADSRLRAEIIQNQLVHPVNILIAQ